MKLLSKITNHFSDSTFDIEYETDMVQSRILSPIIEAYEQKGMTQSELSEKTGLSQSFISSIFNVRKRISMKHIALLQNALGIILQKPESLVKEKHVTKYYSKDAFFTEKEQGIELHEFISKNIKRYGDKIAMFTCDDDFMRKHEKALGLHKKSRPQKKGSVSNKLDSYQVDTICYPSSHGEEWKKIASTSI